MAGKMRKSRWSFKEDRTLMELAASQPIEAIADRFGRPVESIRKMAIRLGVSVKSREARREPRSL